MTSKRWLAVIGGLVSAVAISLGAGLLRAIDIVHRADYPATAGDPAVELQDSAFRIRNRSCDVLIDGDSTAEVGIDPRVLTAQTGLTACNIATSRPVVDDLGTLPLDTFLQHNPKPKLLVIQYGAEEFYRSGQPWEHVGPYTPLTLIARNLPKSDALRIMLKHPAETVQFIVNILKMNAMPPKSGRGERDARFRRAIAHAEASNGQLDLDVPPQTRCEADVRPLDGPLDGDRIQQLRERYERQGIAVLIRAAPVPDCDRRLTQFVRDLAPWVDGNVEQLPIDLFASADRHPTQSGSRIASLGLVNLIDARQAQLVAMAKSGFRPYPSGALLAKDVSASLPAQ